MFKSPISNNKDNKKTKICIKELQCRQLHFVQCTSGSVISIRVIRICDQDLVRNPDL